MANAHLGRGIRLSDRGCDTVGVPNWLRPAVQTKFYIKAGLVIMGFSVLFSTIVNIGLCGLGNAWIVTPIAILFMWWFGIKVLKIDNKLFVITVATATSFDIKGACKKMKKKHMFSVFGIW